MFNIKKSRNLPFKEKNEKFPAANKHIEVFKITKKLKFSQSHLPNTGYIIKLWSVDGLQICNQECFQTRQYFIIHFI